MKYITEIILKIDFSEQKLHRKLNYLYALSKYSPKNIFYYFQFFIVFIIATATKQWFNYIMQGFLKKPNIYSIVGFYYCETNSIEILCICFIQTGFLFFIMKNFKCIYCFNITSFQRVQLYHYDKSELIENNFSEKILYGFDY